MVSSRKTGGKRAALYLRVSTGEQTTADQRRVLTQLAEHRELEIVREYEDQGISGSKGRDKRRAFNEMLKDAARRRFDILLVWSMDRLGRSVLHVAQAMADLDAAGVALFSEQQGIDTSGPFGRAMMQLASVFAELERSMIVSRINAGIARVKETGKTKSGKPTGRPKVSAKTEAAIRARLDAGDGILKTARGLGVGSGTVQRVKRAMEA